tara:strand:+ start:3431 stop:7408 length:3978 start_codon:yes stop_codon:yes gene_type:complete
MEPQAPQCQSWHSGGLLFPGTSTGAAPSSASKATGAETSAAPGSASGATGVVPSAEPHGEAGAKAAEPGGAPHGEAGAKAAETCAVLQSAPEATGARPSAALFDASIGTAAGRAMGYEDGIIGLVPRTFFRSSRGEIAPGSTIKGLLEGAAITLTTMQTRTSEPFQYPGGNNSLSLIAQSRAIVHVHLCFEPLEDEWPPTDLLQTKIVSLYNALIIDIKIFLMASDRIIYDKGEKVLVDKHGKMVEMTIPLQIEPGIDNHVVPAPVLAIAMQHAIQSWQECSKSLQEKEKDNHPDKYMLHKLVNKHLKCSLQSATLTIQPDVQEKALAFVESALFIMSVWEHGEIKDPFFNYFDGGGVPLDQDNCKDGNTHMVSDGYTKNEQVLQMQQIMLKVKHINPATVWKARQYVEDQVQWRQRHWRLGLRDEEFLPDTYGPLDIKPDCTWYRGTMLAPTLPNAVTMQAYHPNQFMRHWFSVYPDLLRALQAEGITVMDSSRTSHVAVSRDSLYSQVYRKLAFTRIAGCEHECHHPWPVEKEDQLFKISAFAHATHHCLTRVCYPQHNWPSDGRIGPYLYWLLPPTISLFDSNASKFGSAFYRNLYAHYWANDSIDANVTQKALCKTGGWLQRTAGKYEAKYNALMPDTGENRLEPMKRPRRYFKAVHDTQTRLCKMLDTDDHEKPVWTYWNLKVPEELMFNNNARCDAPFSDAFWLHVDGFIQLSAKISVLGDNFWVEVRPDGKVRHGVQRPIRNLKLMDWDQVFPLCEKKPRAVELSFQTPMLRSIDPATDAFASAPQCDQSMGTLFGPPSPKRQDGKAPMNESDDEEQWQKQLELAQSKLKAISDRKAFEDRRAQLSRKMELCITKNHAINTQQSELIKEQESLKQIQHDKLIALEKQIAIRLKCMFAETIDMVQQFENQTLASQLASAQIKGQFESNAREIQQHNTELESLKAELENKVIDPNVVSDMYSQVEPVQSDAASVSGQASEEMLDNMTASALGVSWFDSVADNTAGDSGKRMRRINGVNFTRRRKAVMKVIGRGVKSRGGSPVSSRDGGRGERRGKSRGGSPVPSREESRGEGRGKSRGGSPVASHEQSRGKRRVTGAEFSMRKHARKEATKKKAKRKSVSSAKQTEQSDDSMESIDKNSDDDDEHEEDNDEHEEDNNDHEEDNDDHEEDNDDHEEDSDDHEARICLGPKLYKKTMEDVKAVDALIDSGDTMNEKTHKVTDAHAGCMINNIQYCTAKDESLKSIAKKLKIEDQQKGPVILWLLNKDIYDLDYPVKTFKAKSTQFLKNTILYVPRDVGKDYRSKHFLQPVSINAKQSRRNQD